MNIYQCALSFCSIIPLPLYRVVPDPLRFFGHPGNRLIIISPLGFSLAIAVRPPRPHHLKHI